MIVAKSSSEFHEARARLGSLALVAVNGPLHAGHLSLIEMAKRLAKSTAVSICPLNESLDGLELFAGDDTATCKAAGVDILFLPEPLRASKKILIDFPDLTAVMEGKHRPAELRNTCCTLLKVLHVVHPDVLVLGQKRFQQGRVIREMIETLEIPVALAMGPIIRDADGIAAGNQNAMLSRDERKRAAAITRGLSAAVQELQDGLTQANRLTTTVQKILLEQHLAIDYVAAVDPLTLREVDFVTSVTLLAVAARVGRVRLLDNVLLEPVESPKSDPAEKQNAARP